MEATLKGNHEMKSELPDTISKISVLLQDEPGCFQRCLIGLKNQ